MNPYHFLQKKETVATKHPIPLNAGIQMFGLCNTKQPVSLRFLLNWTNYSDIS